MRWYRRDVEVSNKPVTVKMHKGWDDEHILAVENALRFRKLVHRL